MMYSLTPRQAGFVKNLTKGHNQQESAILAGYSPKTASSQSSQLLRNTKVIQALEKAGITDKYIAKNLKQHIDDGIGVKPSADTSLRALDIATKLRGYQQPEKQGTTNLSQTNIHIQEFKAMSTAELNERLKQLVREIQELQK